MRIDKGEMTSSLSLKEVLSKAPNIHVFDSNGVTVLKQKKNSAEYKDTPLSKHSIYGDGTRQHPFTTSAMDVNPYNAIVDLWLQNLSFTSQHTNPIFIQVNDWILQVGTDGVTSEDSHFTKLMLD